MHDIVKKYHFRIPWREAAGFFLYEGIAIDDFDGSLYKNRFFLHMLIIKFADRGYSENHLSCTEVALCGDFLRH